MKRIEEFGQTETVWNRINKYNNGYYGKNIGYIEYHNKQNWITLEILVDTRWKFKEDKSKYKDINKTICRRCREARYQWLSKQCRKTEAYKKRTIPSTYIKRWRE